MKAATARIRNAKGFLSLLELLLVAVILLFIGSLGLKRYFGQCALNKETKEMFKQQGISTESYQSTLESTKARINQVNEQLNERARQIEQYK